MFSQILLNSIISALPLSLIAIGFNLIFNATKVFHLAHGATYISAIYAVYGFNKLLKQVYPDITSFVLSIVLSLLVISILIVIIEYLIYRPLYLQKANPTISLISSLGVYFLILNFITFFFGNASISLRTNSKIVLTNSYFIMTDIELIILAASTVLICLVLYFSKTKLYTHIRAITDSYPTAEKYGINVQRTRIVALLFGTLLAGIAGIMRGYEVAIEPNIGLTIVLIASVAVIAGGVNSIFGTLIACFLISIIENYSVKLLSAQWKDILTYSILIGVLIINRQGLISVKQRIELK